MNDLATQPEIGKRIEAAGLSTNVHDLGTGFPLLMLHGSGPGVSAFANWRLVMPSLSESRRLIAPDMVGFGFTDRPAHFNYSLDAWVTHAIGVLDSLAIDRADIVGNSFGGGLALALAIRHPQRVRRLVLMGSVGVPFELTPGLDAVWGYTPSIENMRDLMHWFAYDHSLASDALVELRYQASIRPGVQESFSSMFPAPRQQAIDDLCSAEGDLRTLPHETLVLHGREDKIIPLSNAYTLAEWIPNAQLHVFSRCGHWTQIEHADRFSRLVEDFLSEADEQDA